ncbi:MAG TPA: glycine cleavage system aminomethyltransferase GcvT [Vicinamibacterales bacterium]|nr:glycine cleavage system aminomethyltransferase GcvT [Vicinamibacterales bacterium]
MSVSSSGLKQTPLHATHLASGARMVDFGGWDMPVEYSGITDEHVAVRTRAGLFDVSHMGQIELAGADALATVQALTSNDASRLAIGQAQYSALTTAEGTFVDDILVYRLTEQHFLLVVNAANAKKDYAWIAGRAAERGGNVAVVDTSARYALIALQGPASPQILRELTAIELDAMRYYWFGTGEVAGVRATVSRTGYTGEDGFEIFVAPAQAPRVWQALLQAGAAYDIRPCGLGARDTLRLEACMRLYGNEMDETVSVLEAGLEWIVAWQKPDFLGAARLREQKAAGVTRRLVAFEMIDRAIARHGHPVVVDGVPVGVVTSGTQTPTIKKAVGLAMVPVGLTTIGTELQIDVRGRCVRAQVVKEPFYKRPRPARDGR